MDLWLPLAEKMGFPYACSMKVVAQNRRARFEFEILETVEAGIQLTGPEVKSCRLGHVNLAGSYVSFLGGVPQLKNAKISKYAYADGEGHREIRDRVLLLKAREGEKLERALTEKGIALVPLEVKAGRYIKLVLGLGRGRKRFDKRRVIRDREMGRNVKEGREI